MRTGATQPTGLVRLRVIRRHERRSWWALLFSRLGGLVRW
jgi:hypothetical protein